MKKIFGWIMLLGAAVGQAATIDMRQAPDDVLESIVYWADFESEEPEVNDLGLGLIPYLEEGVTRIGSDEGYSIRWRDGLWNHPVCKSGAYTLSFDVHELKGETGRALMSLYTAGGSRENGLIFKVGKRGTLELVCNGFSNATKHERRNKISLGKMSELAQGKTITIVYDGDQKTICAYVNGKRLEKTIKLKYAGATPQKDIHSMQFGGYYGAAHAVRRAKLDNVCIWNEALTDEQVASIVEGYISPVVFWSLVSAGGVLLLAGGCFVVYRCKSRRAKA